MMNAQNDADRVAKLEQALQRIMPIPADEIADILEARADGRLTIWPRTGQALYYDGKGMCERCPIADTEECPYADECGSGELCPSFVTSEPWLGGEDPDQRDLYLDGAFYLSEAAAKAAILGEE